MSVKITKLLKDGLTVVENTDVSAFGLSNSTSMTISHYADSEKQTGVTIPFEIEGTNLHVATMEDVEFQLVARERIDLTATGPHPDLAEDAAPDKGEYKHKDSVPRRPVQLPLGFEELKGK